MIKKIVNKSIHIFSTYCNRVIFGDLKVSYLSKDHSQVEFTPQFNLCKNQRQISRIS